MRIRSKGRFGREQGGQALVFGAVSLLLVAGFVALVYNVGRAAQKRVQVQLAADMTAYSGAAIKANALSSIAWINDGMAQVYYNMMRYAVDVNTAGLVAELEYRQNGNVPDPSGAGYRAYQEAYGRAAEWIPRGKEWLLDLSRIENAIALVAPRLMQEEMYDVALAAGAERISMYPSHRLLPHEGSEAHYLIEQFTTDPKGWRITNLGTGEMIWVYGEMVGDGKKQWHIVFARGDGTQEEVTILEDVPGERWVITRTPPGNIITIINHPDLGWIVHGQPQGPQGDINIQFISVDMDDDGVFEGTRVTFQGESQIFKREDGNLYIWDPQEEEYVNSTSNETTIGGVDVAVNVTNRIHFPGAVVNIGTPVRVHIGRAHIVLRDPPTISTGLWPVHIGITGFDADSFSISVGGFSLNNVNARDGSWRKRFDAHEELWWRHRLVDMTEPDPPTGGADRQWRYDYEYMGAHMRYESNYERFMVARAIRDRIGDTADLPQWYAWFDPTLGRPRNATYRQTTFTRSGGLMVPTTTPPPDAYYLTQTCRHCNGVGANPANPDETCSVCAARDHDRDGLSDVRVFIADVAASTALGDRTRQTGETDYVDARANFTADPIRYPTRPAYPLVLTEEFFKYGINIAAWHRRFGEAPADEPERTNAPMIFDNEPEWGFAAIASARIGIPEGDPAAPSWRYQFQSLPGVVDARSRDVRQQWVEDAVENLYSPRIAARLVSTKGNINDHDLEHYTDIEENAMSYLMDVMLGARYSRYAESTWLNRYDGRSDPTISQRLRTMRDRNGRAFQIRSPEVEDVIHH